MLLLNLGVSLSDGNPQPIEICQNIANIGMFVMKQTVEMQMAPAREPVFTSLETLWSFV